MDAVGFVLAVMAGAVVCYNSLLLGRAIAARIAGDNAYLALSAPLFAIVAPLPHRKGDDNDENNMETGNTATRETLGNSVGNTDLTTVSAVPMMQVTSAGRVSIVPSLSKAEIDAMRAERDELDALRHDAIGLLDRCIKYYKDNGKTDEGTIPRYDKIGMKSENRGVIVNALWYSGLVNKTQNRTWVNEESLAGLGYSATCAALLHVIAYKRVKVFPVGYNERKHKTLDSAFDALPEANEE